MRSDGDITDGEAEPRAAPAPRRLLASVAVGLAAAALTTHGARILNPHFDLHSDFDQLWVAARALWAGQDPYALIGPDGPIRWPWPLVYPASSAALVLPLAPLPLPVARAVAVGTGAGVLAWCLTRAGWWPLLLLGSAPAIDAVRAGQWSPWIAASVLCGGVAWIAAVKPLGAMLALASLDRRTVIRAVLGGAALCAIATWLLPRWWSGFFDGIGGIWHVRVLAARPLGVLCLLALLRWQRPEARVLLALLLTPLTPSLYEMLPLMLVATSWREAAALVVLSTCTRLCSGVLVPLAPPDLRPDRAADIVLAGLFVPALVLVLRRPASLAHPLWIGDRPRPSLPGVRQAEGRVQADPS